MTTEYTVGGCSGDECFYVLVEEGAITVRADPRDGRPAELLAEAFP